MVLLTVGLIISKLLFQIPIIGSLTLMYLYTIIYILVSLGMGLFISNFTDTQQQAMFIAWFFLMIFVLMSGLFTPIESMPLWAQKMTLLNPIAYFVDVMRMVLLKGSGIWDIRSHFFSLLIYALIINSLAMLNYRKTGS